MAVGMMIKRNEEIPQASPTECNCGDEIIKIDYAFFFACAFMSVIIIISQLLWKDYESYKHSNNSEILKI